MAGEDEDQGLGFSQTEVAPGVINFAVGTPGASLIPKQDLDAAFAAALAANNDPLIYQYARIEGTLAFRQSLADFLNAHGCPSPVTGFRIAPENLCVSFGNSLALATIAVSILEFSFVYVCGHMHVCMYACMHVCMYACMHVCMYVYVMYA
jgi:DNA-binding transcriptional MocR family regulator